MKTISIFSACFFVLSLLLISCSVDENEVQTKTTTIIESNVMEQARSIEDSVPNLEGQPIVVKPK